MKKGPGAEHSPSGDGRKVKDQSGHQKGDRDIGAHVLVNTEKRKIQNTKSEQVRLHTSCQYQQQMARR